MRKAKVMQLNLAELTQGRNPAERLITRDLQFAPNVNITDMTTAVRRYLGVSLEQQCAWRDDETALKEWRAALPRVGVFVFKDAFRTADFAGFCLSAYEFPRSEAGSVWTEWVGTCRYSWQLATYKSK